MNAERKITLGLHPVALERVQHLRALEPRHADVEQRHVGPDALDLVERVAAVLGLAHQLEVGALLDRPDDALAVDRVVVRDSTRTRACFGLTAESSLRGRRRLAAEASPAVAGNPDAQPEAIPDLELRQPGTGQGAITTPKGRGVQLTTLEIENVPEGCRASCPDPISRLRRGYGSAICTTTCSAPQRGGVDGGTAMLTLARHGLIIRSAEQTIDLYSSDRRMQRSSDRRMETRIDAAQARPMTLSRRVRHWAANACVSSREAPNSSQSSSLVGPRRLQHPVGDRQRLGQRPLDRLAVALVLARHVGRGSGRRRRCGGARRGRPC